MKRFSALVLSLGLLAAGCSTVIEGQQQHMTLLTPGADNAECIFYNKDMRFVLRTDETRIINKSDRKLTADCRASGNRHRELIISPQLEKTTLGNAVTGVIPGVGYDHLSKGMYVYPETITVDFSNVAASAYPLPDYMNGRLNDVYHGDMERYGADRTKLPGDSQAASPLIEKKTSGELSGNPFGSVMPPPDMAGTYMPVPVTEK